MNLVTANLDMFNTVFARLYEAVFITNIDGVIIFANPAFEELYGYSESEWKGQTPRILKSGVINQENYARFWQKLLTKETIYGELVNKKKNGDLVTVSGSVGPILDNQGLIAGFVSIQHDVTENKSNEKELKKFKLGIDKINDVVFMTNAQGEFEYINSRFTDLYDYSLSDLAHKTPRVLKSGKQSGDFYVNFWQTLLAKKPITADLVNRNKNGDEIIVEASATAILDDFGEIVGFLAVQRDVTDLRKTTHQLEEKINETNAMNKLMVSRELKMIELKETIAQLQKNSKQG